MAKEIWTEEGIATLAREICNGPKRRLLVKPCRSRVRKTLQELRDKSVRDVYCILCGSMQTKSGTVDAYWRRIKFCAGNGCKASPTSGVYRFCKHCRKGFSKREIREECTVHPEDFTQCPDCLSLYRRFEDILYVEISQIVLKPDPIAEPECIVRPSRGTKAEKDIPRRSGGDVFFRVQRRLCK